MYPITFSKTQSKFPYFNDYEVEKNFYKILFKSTNEIQVRELNQLQTIYKEQFARFASHIFTNGSLVSGCDHLINTSAVAITIEFDSKVIDEEFFNTIETKFFVSSYIDKFGNSNIKSGQILFPAIQTSEIFWTFIVNELSSEGFFTHDICSVSNDPKIFSEKTFKVIERNDSVFIKFNTGIIYLNGSFIHVKEQKLILSKNSNKFTGSIGFFIDHTIENDEFKTDKEKTNLILISKEIINDDNSLSKQLISFNFIEFLRVSDGILLKDIRVPIYSNLEETLARRTYDESGSYTVNPFSIKILNSEKSKNNFTLEISPGKAYVLGYEFDSISTRYLEIPRSLETHKKENFEISTYYGNFIILESFSGYFNVQECEKIDLLDKHLAAISFLPGGNYNSSIIGNARVRFVRFLETELHLYLFDIVTNDNKTFLNVESVCASNILSSSRGKGNIHGNSKIYEKEFSGLMFELPDDMIKTFKTDDGDILSDYTFQKVFTGCLFEATEISGEVITFLESNPDERFITSPDNFIIVSRSTGLYSIPEEVNTLNSDNTLVSLKLTSGHFIADVYALINANFAKERSKIKELKTIEKLLFNNLIKNQIIDLQFVDVIKIISCFINGGDKVQDFILLDGKNKETYNNSKIKYIGNTINSNVSLDIQFEYFSRKGSGYFSCDSYLSLDDIIDENINDTIFKLRKIIDFRPENINGIISNAQIPIPDGNFECSYTYYLGRRDKLVITSSKNFEIISGVSATKPVYPFDKSDAMTIYGFDIPAFSNNPKDVNVLYFENKRYTMRDIGKLEQRIEKIEYYTALSLLEKETKDLEILDENGNSRFKNGFLVDNFKTFKSIDAVSKENNCSLDTSNAILRPSFDMYNHELLYNPYESNTRRTSDLITIPYTEKLFVEQSKVTETINLQSFEVFTWQGTVDLLPENDEWVDTETKPAISANLFGSTDVWDEIGTKAFTAQWGSWEKNILSVPETQNVSSAAHVSPIEIPTESIKRLWNPSVDSNVDITWIEAYNSWVTFLEEHKKWKLTQS